MSNARSVLSRCGECWICSGSKKHAVLQHDLKKNRISILSSKFEVFKVGDIHREQMPNLENNVKFEKIIIFDTHIRHIWKFWEFPKKNFFLDFRWDLQLIFLDFWIFTNFAQFYVPHVRKSKFLCETMFWYLKSKNIDWYAFSDM